MDKKIPISIITRPDQYIIYFDAGLIGPPNNIGSANIVAIVDTCFNGDLEITPRTNDYLSDDEQEFLDESRRSAGCFDRGRRIFIDVTEAVKQIVSGYVENKGIILESSEPLRGLGLLLHCRGEKIYPFYDTTFYEKVIRASAYTGSYETQWFYIGESDTISFFVHNMGENDVTVYTEISPDAIRQVNGAPRTIVQPNKILTVVPDKFAKFIRLVATSEMRRVLCKIWFQAQKY